MSEQPLSGSQQPWSQQHFEQELRAMERLYHIHHPFHVRMNSGGCTRQEIQCWVANRFYYQTSIPVKDAAIVSNCPDQAVRKAWIVRILDHDGAGQAEGGIEAWLRLGEAVGLKREDLLSQRLLLPGVKFACDAYVEFARRAPWQEAVCSSLTEMFAPTIHKKRLDNWPQHYPWIEAEGYAYFRRRLSEARRDVEYGLGTTLRLFRTRSAQERAKEILRFKLQVLWSMLDAMQMATEFGQPPFFCCASEQGVAERE